MKKVIKIGYLLLNIIIISFAEVYAKSDPNTLSFAWEAAPRVIDPRFAVDANSHYLIDLVHCSLINFDQEGNVFGQLATKWEWSDTKTLKVTLRKDAKFSDGTLLTADDVIATYNFLILPNAQASPLAGAFKNLKAIKALSADQVQFELKEADSTFVSNLMIGILPKRLASHTIFHHPKDLVGCGPFNLTDVKINDYVLSRNENYSLGAKPKIKTIIIKIVKDEMTRFSKLLKGELDLVQNGIGRDKLKTISKSHPELTIQARPGINVSYLGFNFRDKLLANKEVRQAINFAINRKEIIDYILQGMAIPADSFLSPGNTYRSTQKEMATFDPAQAKLLLDKAGYPQPANKSDFRFVLSLKTTADPTRVNIANAIAGQLRQIGIKVEIQSLEWGKFKSDLDKGTVQLWMANWIGYKDPDIYRYAFATESFPPQGANRGWYSNPKLDALLLEGNRINDLSRRKDIYKQAQTLVAEDIPYAFLWHEENYVVHRQSLKDFSVYADGRMSSLVRVTN